jgi:hypothetical protein
MSLGARSTTLKVAKLAIRTSSPLSRVDVRILKRASTISFESEMEIPVS